jgi:hypothetical protein
MYTYLETNARGVQILRTPCLQWRNALSSLMMGITLGSAY